MRTFDSEHARSFRIQSWGLGPTSRESPYHVSCTFEGMILLASLSREIKVILACLQSAFTVYRAELKHDLQCVSDYVHVFIERLSWFQCK